MLSAKEAYYISILHAVWRQLLERMEQSFLLSSKLCWTCACKINEPHTLKKKAGLDVMQSHHCTGCVMANKVETMHTILCAEMTTNTKTLTTEPIILTVYRRYLVNRKWSQNIMYIEGLLT